MWKEVTQQYVGDPVTLALRNYIYVHVYIYFYKGTIHRYMRVRLLFVYGYKVLCSIYGRICIVCELYCWLPSTNSCFQVVATCTSTTNDVRPSARREGGRLFDCLISPGVTKLLCNCDSSPRNSYVFRLFFFFLFHFALRLSTSAVTRGRCIFLHHEPSAHFRFTIVVNRSYFLLFFIFFLLRLFFSSAASSFCLRHFDRRVTPNCVSILSNYRFSLHAPSFPFFFLGALAIVMHETSHKLCWWISNFYLYAVWSIKNELLKHPLRRDDYKWDCYGQRFLSHAFCDLHS